MCKISRRLIVEVFDLCDLDKDRRIDVFRFKQIIEDQSKDAVGRESPQALQDFAQMVLSHYNRARAGTRSKSPALEFAGRSETKL